MKRDTETYLQEAIANIRRDRATTQSILVDAMVFLKKNEENHKSVGPVVSKYLETLQRSNEQLVKIIGMIHTEKEEDTSLTDEDKEGLFDMIQEPK